MLFSYKGTELVKFLLTGQYLGLGRHKTYVRNFGVEYLEMRAVERQKKNIRITYIG